MSSRFSMKNLLQSFRAKSASHDAAKRPNRARTLRLEALESRELLDAAGYHGAVSDSDLIPTVVTTVADVVNPNDGYISLREAIANAGVDVNSSTVTFAPEVIGQVIKLSNDLGTLTITKHVTVDAWTATTQDVNPGSLAPNSLGTDGLPPGSYFLPEGNFMSLGVTIDGVNLIFKADSGPAVGQPLIRVHDGGMVTLTGLTITNSNPNLTAESFDAVGDGAGLLVDGSARVFLNNSTIRGLRYRAGYYEQLEVNVGNGFQEPTHEAGGAVIVKDTAHLTATSVLIADNIALCDRDGVWPEPNFHILDPITGGYVDSNNDGKPDRTRTVGFYGCALDVCNDSNAYLINCTVAHNNHYNYDPDSGEKDQRVHAGYGVSCLEGADDDYDAHVHVVNTILAENSYTYNPDIISESDVRAHDGSESFYFSNSILDKFDDDTAHKFLAYDREAGQWSATFPVKQVFDETKDPPTLIETLTSWSDVDDDYLGRIYHYVSDDSEKIFVNAEAGDYTLACNGNNAINNGHARIYENSESGIDDSSSAYEDHFFLCYNECPPTTVEHPSHTEYQKVQVYDEQTGTYIDVQVYDEQTGTYTYQYVLVEDYYDESTQTWTYKRVPLYHQIAYHPGALYDLSGKPRVKTIDGKKYVDIGAYGLGVDNGDPTPTYPVPRVYVTIGNDEFATGTDDTNDFNISDGTPHSLSLREAVWYMNRYWNGGDPNDRNSWVLVDDADVDPQKHSFSAGAAIIEVGVDVAADGTVADEGGYVWKEIRFKDFSSPDDEFINVYLDNSIVSNKTYAIEGVSEGDTHTHNDKKVHINGSATGIFQIASGTVTANNLTLKGNSEVANVGAVNITRGSVTYNTSPQVTVANGYVANGGAFIGNIATNYGGAVYVDAGARFIANDYVTYDEYGVQFTENVEFKNNEAIRGGAICNLGTVTINGSTSFTNNAATGKKTTTKEGSTYSTGSFGGAIYNAGDLYIGASDKPAEKTTFSGNKAGKTDESDLAFKNGVLNGYSGGAIYNTTVKVNGVTHTGNVEAYNVDFENNFAGKYGGAISNFATLTVTNATFENNVASAGGAVQTSGNATFTNSTFTSNTALKSKYALATCDNGGNGGAVFASGDGKSVTFKGATTFTGNQAANAGGAIDFISGGLTFGQAGDTTTITVTGNKASVVGGAIVVASKVSFAEDAAKPTFPISENSISVLDAGILPDFLYKDADPGTSGSETSGSETGGSGTGESGTGESGTGESGTQTPSKEFADVFHKEKEVDTVQNANFYAPNVAVTYNVVDGVETIARNFFGESYTRNQLDTFSRYLTAEACNKVDYAVLADSFPAGVKGTLEYSTDDGATYDELARGQSVSFTENGTYSILYRDTANSDVVFHAYVLVNGGTSVRVNTTQFDLTGMTGVVSDPLCAVGISVQVYSSANTPVSTWTLDWGDGDTEQQKVFENYGFTCNAYHVYTPAQVPYQIRLTAVSSDGETTETIVDGVVAEITIPMSASSAELDLNADDFFADLDLVDELFED